MRDHLLALQQIQEALAKQDYDQAGNIAEQRLGMTSLTLQGADEAAKYMPKGMGEAGNDADHNGKQRRWHQNCLSCRIRIPSTRAFVPGDSS